MFGLFKKKLPHCDELFIKYLSPWYNEDDRPKMTRPDMYQIAAFEGQPLDLDDLQYLMPEYLEQVKAIINDTMTNSALEDFSLIYKFHTISFELLDRVYTYYDRVKITELIKKIVTPKTFQTLTWLQSVNLVFYPILMYITFDNQIYNIFKS